MRSLLFVPGDSPRKFARARETAADALIIDLEDAVLPDAKLAARSQVLAMLREGRGRQKLFVRINAFDTGLAATDLAAVMPGAPDGVFLPKCEGPDHVQRLDHMLEALEAANGLENGRTLIFGIVTETAASLFTLGSYRNCSPRFAGMMWGAEDLAMSLGARGNRDANGLYEQFRLARNLCLAGAAAAGVMPIDTIATDIENLAALEIEVRTARRDGFLAKAVIHPKHVDVVNAAFLPSAEEIAWARRVVEAFNAAEGAGAVRLDGRMLDRPHLQAALRLLDEMER